jgi:hypothetical protein
MAVWRSLVRRFDAALRRHVALAVLACARFWFQLWFRLRRARLIGADLFRTELARAGRLHRLAARAMTVWLRLTRAR